MNATRTDIDIASIWRAIKARRWLLIGLPILIGALTFAALSYVAPVYTSQASLLVDTEETVYTRPAIADRNVSAPRLDQAAVISQVHVLTSYDLTMKVIERLELKSHPDFNPELKPEGLISQLMARFSDTKTSVDEAVFEEFKDNLSVFPALSSNVINIQFSANDSALAAKAANVLADEYVTWQRDAKLQQNHDATNWLRGQIDTLRVKVKDAEGAAEKFRAKIGQRAGLGATNLNDQQLSELNSQLIVAKSQRTEAEARAKLIKTMLRNGEDINAASDIVKAPLIQRLIEQQVAVKRLYAELSATLLPAHPRIQQLNAEMSGINRQIRSEMNKVAGSLVNEAKIAEAREVSLISSINGLKNASADATEDTIKLRALQREAKANRDLLESYLARYRDASARGNSDAVPARAMVISRAHASAIPSFPKKGSIAGLAAAATLLLTFAYIVSAALMGATMGLSPLAQTDSAHVSNNVSSAANATPQYDPKADAEPQRLKEPVFSHQKEIQETVAFEAELKGGDSFDTQHGDAAIAAAQVTDADESRGIYANTGKLADHLRQSQAGDNGYRVLITGMDDETDTCEAVLALGRAIAAKGARVVLVDLSNGSKTISAAMGLARTPGFSEVLTGDTELQTVIDIDAHSDLNVIGSGKPQHDDLLYSSSKTAKALNELDQSYELVLLHGSYQTARSIFKALDADFDAGILLGDVKQAKTLSGLKKENFLGYTVTGLDILFCANQEAEQGNQKLAISA